MAAMLNALQRTLRHAPGYGALKRLYYAGARNEQWARIVMNRATKDLVDGLHPDRLSALEISGERWRWLTAFRNYRTVDYPAFDICAARLPETFDIIFAEQVFEHLLWPYRAARNVYDMLEPGGHFLVTTPFLLKLHPFPHDCSRWTETGIKHFLAEAGFPLEQIKTGAWGNRACINANFKRWIPYRPLIHSLKNETEFPIVVWALARK